MADNNMIKEEEITYEKKRNLIEEDDDENMATDKKNEMVDIKPDDKKVTGARAETVKVNMKFHNITKFFDKVNALRGKEKTKFVHRYFEEYLFKEENRAKAFPLLRLILPHLDRERGSYGLKEMSLGKLVAESLGLPQNDAQRLRFFKNPNYHPNGAPVGDFVGVCISVVRPLCKADSDFMVDDINKFLDELSNAQDFKVKVAMMTSFLKRASAEDLRWTLRIILKDLKIGLKQEKVLPLYHPDALDLYNVTSNLREVCSELLDKTKAMGSDIFRLFQPIKPMLAGKRSAEEIRNLMASKEMLIETKFDGERIQCHFNNEEIKFFSRNSNDYTHIYGPKLIPIVRANISAQAGILDGEVIVLNKHTGEAVAFGMNKTIAMEEDDEDGNEYQLCYMIFDILYVKGPRGEECNLMNVNLRDRKMVLKRVIKPVKRMFEVVVGHETTNVDEIFKEFDKAMVKNEEGVIIKQMNSVYIPNDRGTSWIKLKGEYIEGMYDTLDLLILGGYFGEGRVRIGVGDWTEHITHFLLGVAKSVNDKDPEKSAFLPFCKVGTGYSVEELRTLRNALRDRWKKYDPKTKPGFIGNWNPGSSELPDVIIDSPDHSVVLEVKAAEIIRSNAFLTEYTLRFPRVVKIRYDKDWNECLDEEDLFKMIQMISQTKGLKRIKQGEGENEDAEGEGKDGDTANKPSDKKRGGRTAAKHYGVMSQFTDTDTSQVQVTSSIFEKEEFLIAGLDENYVTKKYLEEQIVRHGGQKVQNFTITTTRVISSYVNFRCRKIIEKHQRNIYKPEWIIECIKRNEVLEDAPKFMLYVVPWARQKMKMLYDVYGDPFYHQTSKEELREIISDMKIRTELISLDDDLRETREELRAELDFGQDHFFRNKAFFHLQHDQSAEMKFIKSMIISKQGDVKTKLIGKIDFVIRSDFDEDQQVYIDKYLNNNQSCRLVDKEWVLRQL